MKSDSILVNGTRTLCNK